MSEKSADRRPSEAGFALLEAVIAAGLVAVSAGAAVAAIAAAAHAAAATRPTAALSLDAQNVLTDLRAAVAYDPQTLAGLAGRSVAFDADESRAPDPPRPVRITVSIAASDGALLATVGVRRPDGSSVSVSAPLRVEAPAPGSVVPTATPPPCAADGGCGAETIPL